MRLRAGIFALAACCAAGCTLLVDARGLAGGGAPDASPDARSDDGPSDRPSVVVATDDASSDAHNLEAPVHPYVQAVLADGPSLYYRFEEASGSIAKDEMGNHPGTHRAGDVLAVAGAFPGSSAMGLSGGTQGGVDPGDIFDFDGTAAFTLEAWFRPDRYDGEYRFLIHHNEESTLRQSYGIYVQTNNGLVFERYVDGDGRGAAVPLPARSSWHHIVGVYDGAHLQLFLDGTLASSAPDLRSAKKKSSVLQIGWGWGDGSGVLRGTLDEVAIYEKALAPERIAAHFEAAR